MRKRLLWTYICITVILVLSSTYMLYQKSQEIYIDGQKTQMTNDAALLEQLLNSMSLEEGLVQVYHYDEQIDMRISLISAEKDNYGKVLVDTQYDEDIMGNHQYRDEVKQALQGQIGHSIRHSNTLNMDFLYVAVPVTIHEQAMVLRVAEPLTEVQLLDKRLIQVGMMAILMAIGVAIGIYYWSLKRLTKPLDEISEGVNQVTHGNFSVKLPSYDDEQFNYLAKSFNQMVKTQKRYINGLEMQHSETEALLNSVGAGIALLTETQEIKRYNRLFAQLLKLEAVDLNGRKLYEAFRKPEFMEQIGLALEKKVYETREIPFKFEDEDCIYKISTVPVLNQEKQIYYGLLVVVEDITQLKSLENMRKDFVANVSHELKTPLTSIRGFIDTLKNGAIDEPEVAGRFLNIIDLEADRFYRLIQQLLYLSQLENSTPTAAVGDINIQDLAEEMAMRFEKAMEDKQIQLMTDIDADSHFRGDIDGLRQIMINLLDNGIKYSKGNTIKLSAKSDDRNLTVTIQDNGIGLSAADQKRIFERFYRVEKSRSQKSGGTGLGLAIVKHLVENAQGTIQLTSQPGQGCQFTIVLPQR